MPCNLHRTKCQLLHCRFCPKGQAQHLVLDSNGKTRSIYCADHTCPARNGDELCKFPKRTADEHCFQHTKCKDLNCVNNARPVFQKFCPTHECSNSTCHEPRAPNSAQCPQHTSIPRCQHEDPCDETELSGSQYCNIHRCQKPKCRNQATSPSGKCEYHVTCEEGGCDNIRAEKSEGVYENYCPQHLRATCGSCDQEVFRNNLYCLNHACGIRECQEPKDENQRANSQFCKTHTCALNGCCQPVSLFRSLDSKYCYRHECAEADCHKKAKISGGLCKEVHGCWRTNCNNRRSLTPNETKYCPTHKCAERDCPEEALKPGVYCQAYHACGEDDCSRRRSTVKYCTTHECKEAGCTKKARDVGGFCINFHACGDPACLERRSSASSDTVYCVRHGCKEPGCNWQARDPDGYCERSHACGVPGCAERRSGSPTETRVCTYHECKHPDCRAKSKVPGGYCLENRHACKEDSCKERRRGNGSELCTEHFYKQELKEEKEKSENLKREIEKQKQTAQPVVTESLQAKEKEGAPQPTKKERLFSKNVARAVLADPKASRDSVEDIPHHSSAVAPPTQYQVPELQSPRTTDSSPFNAVIVMPVSLDRMHQFMNLFNPLHLFRHSASGHNENGEGNARLEGNRHKEGHFRKGYHGLKRSVTSPSLSRAG